MPKPWLFWFCIPSGPFPYMDIPPGGAIPGLLCCIPFKLPRPTPGRRNALPGGGAGYPAGGYSGGINGPVCSWGPAKFFDIDACDGSGVDDKEEDAEIKLFESPMTMCDDGGGDCVPDSKLSPSAC